MTVSVPAATRFAAHEIGEHLDGSRLEHIRIAVSYYCNLRCQHCYVPELNRTKYRTLLEDQQLELEQINAFVDRLVDEMGLRKITITGGEATLHIVWPRTRSVLRHALDRGLTVQLNTSGSGQVPVSTIAAACGDHLDRFVLHLSLDGVDPAKVDLFRGRRGSMDRAVKTLADTETHGMAVDVRYTMTEDNYADTVACYRLVSAHAASSFVVKPMFSAGTARENADLLISRDTVRSIQLDLLAESVDNRTELGLPEPVYVPVAEFPAGANAHVIKCSCGSATAYLSTNGDVLPCSYLVGAPDADRWVLGTIQDPGFDFVRTWREPATYELFRTAPRDENCSAQNIVSGETCCSGAPGAESSCADGTCAR